jgi:hypothetical protein
MARGLLLTPEKRSHDLCRRLNSYVLSGTTVIAGAPALCGQSLKQETSMNFNDKLDATQTETPDIALADTSSVQAQDLPPQKDPVGGGGCQKNLKQLELG